MYAPEGYPEPSGRAELMPELSVSAKLLISLSLVTLATMLAALTIGYNASALGQTVNLRGQEHSAHC